MKKRGLNDEDLALWRKVTDRTERLDLKSLFRAEIDASHPTAPAIRRAQAALSGKGSGMPRKAPTSVSPAFADPLGPASVQMDKKAFTKLKRGKIKPEGKIDLHGMTLDQAHPVLNRYILNAHRSGKRLVLVVTGKGKRRDEGGPIPVRYGVLRHQVLHWLNAPPLSSVVMQVSQAHVSHGADGAYYVYLRRHR
ncbi:Smr/MutS family protein [Sulfitobacter mediterraneus]|uniref:DNA mismatch repair protein MutS n=1 Tax=Sulfitobacter mediterraneus TaxID=83219 RepID=A0A061SVP2_9RHOB|nr:Smr/MutS family protein [Sulfitobacter mediterraneus]KAJ03918.1 DNA mismatch repair protein MutS [Sulfitobacter mediterraneus]